MGPSIPVVGGKSTHASRIILRRLSQYRWPQSERDTTHQSRTSTSDEPFAAKSASQAAVIWDYSVHYTTKHETDRYHLVRSLIEDRE